MGLTTVIWCYILFIVRIIIDTTSMVPIYEQIVNQIKRLVRRRQLTPGDLLPSVRELARKQKISALTVKKAYDTLEAEGYVLSVPGKGTYVAKISRALLREDVNQDIEQNFARVIERARQSGLSPKEICEIFNLVMEDKC